MCTVIVRPSNVKGVFRGAGKRTPAGLVAALDRLCVLIVERVAAGSPLPEGE